MWELIWLMLIMKIPILYLCWVVYWAIKAEPRPEEPAVVSADVGDDPDSFRGRPPRSPRRNGPHGRPARTYARTRRSRVRA
jgi:hypothetical protein